MMRLSLATLLAVLAAPAMAIELPALCLKNAGHEMHDMGEMGETPAMNAGASDPAHIELMAGMDQMNKDMMAGGTASDIDVAFVCSMIPHHQGAIDMAKAELAHGDGPWARELAQTIITAQEKEIADMLAWLAGQPQ